MEEVSFFGGLIAAFAFGTVWFYFACVATFFGIMALSEMEHEIFAIVLLAGFIFLMEKSGAFNIFADPWLLIKWSVLYFVIGVAWSFAKWWSFVVKKAEEFVDNRLYFLKNIKKLVGNNKAYMHDVNHGNAPDIRDYDFTDADEKTKVPEELQDVFLQYLRDHGVISYDQKDRKDVTPSAMENKSKITTWIIWWPTSALWTLLSDPLVRIANWIFKRLKGTYQLISNRAFAKFE